MCFHRENGVKTGWEFKAQKNPAILVNKDPIEAVKALIEKRQTQFKGKE
jgi:hypothetical protein